MAGKLQFKGHVAEIINSVFQSMLVTYLILLLIEQVWESSVSTYLNLNYVLVIVIVAGILDVFSEVKKEPEKPISLKDKIFIYVLGILGFIIIKFKTAELEALSWIISITAGILIILVSVRLIPN